jgi:hypothetical protein
MSERPRVEKLGVRPGDRVVLVGIGDPDLPGELTGRGADVLAEAGSADLVFLGVERADDLDRLPALAALLPPDGALWVVRPKGKLAVDVTERDVFAAGLGIGLVDNKVVSFSDTHTAHRFVVRLRDR